MAETNEKHCYIVDYVSVGQAALDELAHLTENDEIALFCVPGRDKLTFKLFNALNECKANVEIRYAESEGENYKFAFIAFLGFKVGAAPDMKYHIVSKDESIQQLKSFMKNAEVHIQPSISGEEVESEPEVEEEPVQEAAPAASPAPSAPVFNTAFNYVVEGTPVEKPAPAPEPEPEPDYDDGKMSWLKLTEDFNHFKTYFEGTTLSNPEQIKLYSMIRNLCKDGSINPRGKFEDNFNALGEKLSQKGSSIFFKITEIEDVLKEIVR